MQKLKLIYDSITAWCGKNDKFCHTCAGAIISFFIGLILHNVLSQGNKENAAVIGLGVGIFVGAFKELIWDKLLGRGVCTLLDFIATAFGAFTGFVILLMIINNQ